MVIKLPLFKKIIKNNSGRWVNPYIPDRSREGREAEDDLIKNISSNLITRLNQIEEETDFDILLNSSEKEIREEARLLQQEIHDIKVLLKKLK